MVNDILITHHCRYIFWIPVAKLYHKSYKLTINCLTDRYVDVVNLRAYLIRPFGVQGVIFIIQVIFECGVTFCDQNFSARIKYIGSCLVQYTQTNMQTSMV